MLSLLDTAATGPTLLKISPIKSGSRWRQSVPSVATQGRADPGNFSVRVQWLAVQCCDSLRSRAQLLSVLPSAVTISLSWPAPDETAVSVVTSSTSRPVQAQTAQLLSCPSHNVWTSSYTWQHKLQTATSCWEQICYSPGPCNGGVFTLCIKMKTVLSSYTTSPYQQFQSYCLFVQQVLTIAAACINSSIRDKYSDKSGQYNSNCCCFYYCY